MTKKIIAGGCSFTYGSELSDASHGKMSVKSWAPLLINSNNHQYFCTARPGYGNSSIARRVFSAVASMEEVGGVVVMWSFLSRYDWAMPRNKALEDTRWATISPWDTNTGDEEAYRALQGSEAQQEEWKINKELFRDTGVRPFAEAIYKHAANQYHETYLSWKSIIWLQNILEKREIPYMFTLADNTLFYNEFKQHKDQDAFMTALYNEIDFTKWFSFGDRMMGFNQWALMEEYERGTTHPLDEAHQDAVQLMLPTFNKLIGHK